jgi:hypothetical protein
VNEASRDSVAAAAVAAAATARSGDKQMQRRRPREKKKTAAEAENLREGTPPGFLGCAQGLALNLEVDWDNPKYKWS